LLLQDCKKNTAKCVKFRCDIYNMNRKTEVYIHVKARLWNATLVADYPRVDLVKIVSSAELVIPVKYGIQQNKQDDVTSVSKWVL
jgi:integrin alpha 7